MAQLVKTVVLCLCILSAVLAPGGDPEDEETDLFGDTDIPEPPQLIPENGECYLQTLSDMRGERYLTPCSRDGTHTDLISLYDLRQRICKTKSSTAEEIHHMQSVTIVADLILARANGIFIDTDSKENEEFLRNTYICKHHINEIAEHWFSNNAVRHKWRFQHQKRRVIKCAFANMADGFESVTTEERPVDHKDNNVLAVRSVTRDDSQKLLELLNIFAPIGLPLCSKHSSWIKKVIKENAVEDATEEPAQEFPWALRPKRTRKYYSHCSEHSSGKGKCDSAGYQAPVTLTNSQKEQQDRANEALQIQKDVRLFAKVVHVPTAYMTPYFANFDDLSEQSKDKKVVAARKLINILIYGFAPQCPAFSDMVLSDETNMFWNAPLPKRSQELMDNVVEAFSKAETSIVKKQILSLVAPTLSYAKLERFIPGLTHSMFKDARFYAKQHGFGAMIAAVSKLPIQRWTTEQLESFINFLVSPFVVTELPWGTLKLKRSTGIITIPATVRNMVNNRIIDQYYKRLDETGQRGTLGLSRSTLTHILKCCTAKKSKSLAGLDYYSAAAGDAFKQLNSLVKDIGKRTGCSDSASDTNLIVRETKQYFKIGFKLHLKVESRIADHCFGHSLSDPVNSHFQVTCQHEHDDTSLTCDACERMKHVFVTIQKMVEETHYDSEQEKNEAMWLMEKAIADIHKWRAHIVRTIWLDLAKQKILENLKEDEVFITIDFAMKFVPRQAREDQSKWFGKRGLTWHISVGIIKRLGRFFTRVYVHVMQQAQQISAEVTAFLKHVLQTIHEENPLIKKAIIRSDNAPHYKVTAGIISIQEISKGPITITRWIFCEAQSGKGPADRAAAWIKRHVYMYVEEGHDATTAEQFVTAASSYQGLRGISFFVVIINEPTDSSASGRPKTKSKAISGISKLHDFQFYWGQRNEAENIFLGMLRAWRMPGIGDGVPIPLDQSLLSMANKHTVTVLKEAHENQDTRDPTRDYWKLVGESNDEPTQETAENMSQETEQGVPEPDDDTIDNAPQAADYDKDTGYDENVLYNCPEPGCIKQYQFYGSLDRHVAIGSHKFRPERVTLQDAAQGMYLKRLEELYVSPVTAASEEEQENIEARTSHCHAAEWEPQEKGWALRESPSNVRFSKKQVQYLDEKFNEGQQTRRKFDPKELAKQMRKETNGGVPIFDSTEYLTDQQIMSYFSRKSQKQRQESAAQAAGTPPPKKKPKQNDRPTPAVDTELDSEDPEDSEDYVYARRDNYMDDENIPSLDDELVENLNNECKTD